MRPPASSKAYDAEQRSRSRPTVGTRTGCQNQHLLSSGGAAINSISTSTAIQKHFALSIAFAHSTMDKANNYTRKWTRERAPHKANGIRSSIASDTYAYRRLRQPGAIRHRHRIGTRYRGNDHGSRVSSGDASCTN